MPGRDYTRFGTVSLFFAYLPVLSCKLFPKSQPRVHFLEMLFFQPGTVRIAWTPLYFTLKQGVMYSPTMPAEAPPSYRIFMTNRLIHTPSGVFRYRTSDKKPYPLSSCKYLQRGYPEAFFNFSYDNPILSKVQLSF
jgi:hypothetical protein